MAGGGALCAVKSELTIVNTALKKKDVTVPYGGIFYLVVVLDEVCKVERTEVAIGNRNVYKLI